MRAETAFVLNFALRKPRHVADLEPKSEWLSPLNEIYELHYQRILGAPMVLKDFSEEVP